MHCVNSVFMKGILADSHRLALRIGGTQIQDCLLVLAYIYSEDTYEETDRNVALLVLVLLHIWWCCVLRAVSTLNDKPGNHDVIISTLLFLRWWDATEATSNVGSVTPRIAPCYMLPCGWEPCCAFGMTLRKSWYTTMLHTPIFLMSGPNIFHGWKGKPSWVELATLMMQWDSFKSVIW